MFVILIDFISEIGTYAPPKKPKIINNVLIKLDEVLLSLNIILVVIPSTELNIIKDINTSKVLTKFCPQFTLRKTLLIKYTTKICIKPTIIPKITFDIIILKLLILDILNLLNVP